MIISCTNCKKKFIVDSSLIPEKGRLLQCNSCNYKWFFKKENTHSFKDPIGVESSEIIVPTNDRQERQDLADNINDEKSLQKNDETIINDEKSSQKDNETIINDEKLLQKNDETIIKERTKTKKKFNILKPILVFIISFIILIILIDTFKYPISKFLPDIEFLLYSLYETIIDVFLFLQDLI